ncbi:restriction endonuclease subunit S [Salmonella enterica subsp. enterica serovar Havana]|nr:restriction endonuclease subunit S [Salmonella enterica subsp. enterica serovar Havana]HAU7003535.1 restriction endonuclease subunit S [Salmonella enterica subsp. enterica serovar Havana]
MNKLSYLEKLLDGVEVEWLTAAEIFNIKNGYTPSKAKKEFWEDGNIPWFRLEDIRTNGRELNDSIMHVNQAGVKGNLFPKDSIFMSTTATIGEFALVKIPHLTNQQITNFSLTSRFKGIIDIRYLFHRFHHFGEWCKENANKSGGLSIIGIKKLSSYKFPIPCPDNPEKSLAIQSEIVRILDKFTALTAELTAELTMRKKQYNYYRDQLLSFEGGSVEWKSLGEVAIITIGAFVRKDKQNPDADYPVYNGGRTPTGYYEDFNNDGDKIIVSARGANAGFVNKSSTPYWAGNSCYSISVRSTEQLHWMYVYYYLKQSETKLTGIQQKGGIPAVSKKQMEDLLLPIPSKSEQVRIVTILDKFDTLTSSITEGLPREIELRQKQYEYYRDLLFSFPKHETTSN